MQRLARNGSSGRFGCWLAGWQVEPRAWSNADAFVHSRAGRSAGAAGGQDRHRPGCCAGPALRRGRASSEKRACYAQVGGWFSLHLVVCECVQEGCWRCWGLGWVIWAALHWLPRQQEHLTFGLSPPPRSPFQVIPTRDRLEGLAAGALRQQPGVAGAASLAYQPMQQA